MRRAIATVALGAILVGAAAGQSRRERRIAARHPAPRLIPQSVSFISPSVGWAWGPASRTNPVGVLAQTTDGGHSWTEVHAPSLAWPAFRGVRFADRRQGYLFGAGLWATADGGRRWRRVPIRGPVRDVEAGSGWAYALTSVRLYRVTGHVARIGPAMHGAAQLVVHGAAIYLTASRRLWASPDAGRSWRRLTTPCTWTGTYGAALAAWSPTDLGLVCGSQPAAGNQAKTFYASIDGGAHWRLTAQIAFTAGYVTSLAAASLNRWALAEARDDLSMGTNGGQTWRPAIFPAHAPVVEGWRYVAFTDRTHAVAVPWTLNGDVLAFSADGAHSWREVSFAR